MFIILIFVSSSFSTSFCFIKLGQLGLIFVFIILAIDKDMEVSTYMKDGMIDNWDMFEKVLDYSYKMIIQE